MSAPECRRIRTRDIGCPFARTRTTTAVLSALLAIAATARGQDASSATGWGNFSDVELRRIFQHSPVPAPPADPTNAFADDPRAAHFGQWLFFDKRLSRDGTVSCATCHDPQHAFADGRVIARGLSDGQRNTPALWNVAHQRWLYLDGRVDSLWAQALKPLERSFEMGSNRARLAHQVADDADLRGAYEAVFGKLPDLRDRTRFPLDARPDADDPHPQLAAAWNGMAPADRRTIDRIFSNLGKAIAAYERRIVSRRAPFDVFVEGLRERDAAKLTALSESAQRGLRLFIGPANCRLCHSGPLFSDLEFHNIRVPPRGGTDVEDPGRYTGAVQVQIDPFNAASEFSDQRDGAAAQRLGSLINNAQNWGAFRTPSLRNVAKTAPYMRQGQIATLADVLHYYSTLDGAAPLSHAHVETVLKPLGLSETERFEIQAFLESLTDVALPPALCTPPNQPKPD